MIYLTIKALHILSMVLLFGTGLGSAWYKWMADRSGQIAHIANTNRQVVLADWCFTTPTVIFQPISGIALAMMTGIALTTPWIIASLALYALAGACWLPVVWLQIRMHRLARAALESGTALPPAYWRMARAWFWLGVPAFGAMALIVVLMVFRQIPGAGQ